MSSNLLASQPIPIPEGSPGVFEAVRWLYDSGARFIILSPEKDYREPLRGVKWSTRYPSPTEVTAAIQVLDPITLFPEPHRHQPIGIQPESLYLSVLDIDHHAGNKDELPRVEDVQALIDKYPPAAVLKSRSEGRFHLWYHDFHPKGQRRFNTKFELLGLAGDIRARVPAFTLNLTSLAYQLQQANRQGVFPFPSEIPNVLKTGASRSQQASSASERAPPSPSPQTPHPEPPPTPIYTSPGREREQMEGSGDNASLVIAGAPPATAQGRLANRTRHDWEAMKRLFFYRPDMKWSRGHACCHQVDDGKCGRKGNRHPSMLRFVASLLGMKHNWPGRRRWVYEDLVNFCLMINSTYKPPLPASEVIRIVRHVYDMDMTQEQPDRERLHANRQCVNAIISGIRRAARSRRRAASLRLGQVEGVETTAIVRRSRLSRSSVYRLLQNPTKRQAREDRQDAQACRRLFRLGCSVATIARRTRWKLAWIERCLTRLLRSGRDKAMRVPADVATPAYRRSRQTRANRNRGSSKRGPPRKEG